MKKILYILALLSLLILVVCCFGRNMEMLDQIIDTENKTTQEVVENKIKDEEKDVVDELRVVYDDGSEYIIDNEEYIASFMADMEEAMEKKEIVSNRKDFGKIICTVYFGEHVLTFSEVGYMPLIDGNHWLLGNDARAKDVLFTNCLENGTRYLNLQRKEHIDDIFYFFDIYRTDEEKGVIDLLRIKGIYHVLSAINPRYDFNQNLYIYNFFNREKMEEDTILYDWQTQTAKLGTCEYSEEGQRFSNCSDFEIAWIHKMLKSFLINADNQYMDYPTFIREVEEYKKVTWE